MSETAVADIGLIGLAVMGQNLILNAADHGYNVIAFNRTVSKVDHFLANEAKGKLQNFSGGSSNANCAGKLQENQLKAHTQSKNSFPSSRSPAVS